MNIKVGDAVFITSMAILYVRPPFEIDDLLQQEDMLRLPTNSWNVGIISNVMYNNSTAFGWVRGYWLQVITSYGTGWTILKNLDKIT